MQTINFLKIKTDMVFQFDCEKEVRFSTLLLNDENPYWAKWLSEQKGPEFKYECPSHWDVDALVYILKEYA